MSAASRRSGVAAPSANVACNARSAASRAGRSASVAVRQSRTAARSCGVRAPSRSAIIGAFVRRRRRRGIGFRTQEREVAADDVEQRRDRVGRPAELDRLVDLSEPGLPEGGLERCRGLDEPEERPEDRRRPQILVLVEAVRDLDGRPPRAARAPLVAAPRRHVPSARQIGRSLASATRIVAVARASDQVRLTPPEGRNPEWYSP